MPAAAGEPVQSINHDGNRGPNVSDTKGTKPATPYGSAGCSKAGT